MCSRNTFREAEGKQCLSHLAGHLSNIHFSSFADLVCFCQWLFWTNSFWKMVHRSLQCGKMICVFSVIFNHNHESFLSKQSLSKSSPLKFCNMFVYGVFLIHLLDVHSNASTNSWNIWEILSKRKHAEISRVIQDFPKRTGL